jgi:hypothetical protein
LLIVSPKRGAIAMGACKIILKSHERAFLKLEKSGYDAQPAGAVVA